MSPSNDESDDAAKPIAPQRSATIDGKSVAVFDGLVADNIVSRIKEILDASPFQHNEIARPDTAQYRHWANNMTVEAARNLPFHGPTLAAAKAMGRGTFSVYRAYTNFAAFGDMLFTHTDCLPGAGELTALWFVSNQWNVEWGGETLFFNADEDAEFVVSPRPGRLVLFDGELRHCGRPPNRICTEPRYTLAFKLELAKNP
ncbi:MAG: 2OG-Fe(II) oxygenase [Lysobacterales bacterium]